MKLIKSIRADCDINHDGWSNENPTVCNGYFAKMIDSRGWWNVAGAGLGWALHQSQVRTR